MAINKEIVGRGLEMAKTSYIYGHPWERLTRDELMALGAIGWSQYQKELEKRMNYGMELPDLRKGQTC